MNSTLYFNTVNDYNKFNQNPTLHPSVSVVDLSKAAPRYPSRMRFGIYAIFLKEVKCGDIRYGKTTYDYQEGTLMFVSPGQVIEVENNQELYYPKGLVLVFDSDFLHGTELSKKINGYQYFSYKLNEALHISEKERAIVIDILNHIQFELQQNIDLHSKTLVINYVETLLNYCNRFYDRQFITRQVNNKSIVDRFQTLLHQYIHSDKISEIGIPTVQYCANELNLSPNYFGDLIKKETGMSPLEIIQTKLVDIAKEKIGHTDQSISEISYSLGFKYPHHFNRIFKQKVGQTPLQYRQSPQL